MTAVSARIPAGIILASAAMLGGALFFQYGMNLAPCELCVWQRWAYAPPVALAMLGLFLPGSRRWLAMLAAFAFLAGAGIAGFHVGVEHGWWQGLPSCTGAVGAAKTLEEMRAQLMAAPPVRCDQVAWSLFGISMAGWNMIAQIVFAAVVFQMVRRPA